MYTQADGGRVWGLHFLTPICFDQLPFLFQLNCICDDLKLSYKYSQCPQNQIGVGGLLDSLPCVQTNFTFFASGFGLSFPLIVCLLTFALIS